MQRKRRDPHVVSWCAVGGATGVDSCQKDFSFLVACSADTFWPDRTACECTGTILFFVDKEVRWAQGCIVAGECP